MTVSTSLGGGAGAWRGLSFPPWRVSPCYITLQGTPRGALPGALGAFLGAPPMPAQKDQGARAGLGDLEADGGAVLAET